MLLKILVLSLLFLIILSLAGGMVTLIKDKEQTNRTVKFLTVRIVLSISLFVLLIVAFLMGWIQPHGVVPG